MTSNSSDPPRADKDNEENNSGITPSEHARLRSKQGRPIAQVVNDVQRAKPTDVFIQPDDDRFVVRGPKGREHILEADGEHVTTVRRPDAAHKARLNSGAIRPAEEVEIQNLKGFTK